MSEKEKQVMERLAENLKDMDDEDKNSLIERAEGMRKRIKRVHARKGRE